MTGTTRPGTGTASDQHHKDKAGHANKRNTPRQPNQEEQGTTETRAQHARPHSTPQPGRAGNKQGARTNTHRRTAPQTRRCRESRGTGARAHTHPNTPRGVAGRSRNPDPSTHAHTAHRNRKPRGAGEARAQPRASHITNHDRWGAGRNASPTRNATNPSRQKRDDTTNRTQTHPPKTPARTGRAAKTHTQPQPRPKHKHHTTAGNPVSKARTLRQPVPCS